MARYKYMIYVIHRHPSSIMMCNVQGNSTYSGLLGYINSISLRDDEGVENHE